VALLLDGADEVFEAFHFRRCPAALIGLHALALASPLSSTRRPPMPRMLMGRSGTMKARHGADELLRRLQGGQTALLHGL
jgi:hypothetical protein